jgi:hypothetical protein
VTAVRSHAERDARRIVARHARQLRWTRARRHVITGGTVAAVVGAAVALWVVVALLVVRLITEVTG